MLLACADPIDSAKQSLEGTLTNQASIKYRDVQLFPGDTVCGEYHSVDQWGKGDRFKRFIVRGDRVSSRPEELDWKIYCSEQPGEALLQELGIGPVDNSMDESLRKIREDVSVLQAALAEYRAANGSLPRTDPGLQALLSPAEHGAVNRKNPGEGFLEALPMDPWGRPYNYWRKRMLSVSHIYDIRTLGADGEEGGRGADADIGLQELEYIDHILGL